jgi:hypothetical protein
LHVLNIRYGYLLSKYLKCSVWRLAVRYDICVCVCVSGGKGLSTATGNLPNVPRKDESQQFRDIDTEENVAVQD